MSNLNLNNQLAIELGLNPNVFNSRRPYAKEIFKVYDIELLPNAALDTILCEIYEWRGRNWRSLEKNLIGFIARDSAELTRLVEEVKNIPKLDAQVPDFEFTKSDLIDFEFKLPFLFDLKFNGDYKKTKDISIKVDTIKRSRITNINNPGIEILNLLSEYKLNKTSQYRKNIKSNYIANNLFYAKSIEIEITNDTVINAGFSFDVENTNIEVGIDTDFKKTFKLSYKNNELCPFGAGMITGKHF